MLAAIARATSQLCVGVNRRNAIQIYASADGMQLRRSFLQVKHERVERSKAARGACVWCFAAGVAQRKGALYCTLCRADLCTSCWDLHHNSRPEDVPYPRPAAPAVEPVGDAATG